MGAATLLKADQNGEQEQEFIQQIVAALQFGIDVAIQHNSEM